MPEDLDKIREHLSVLDRDDPTFSLHDAVATFLYMVMPIDGHTHPKELDRLSRILSDDFNLDEKATQKLIRNAEIRSDNKQGMESAAKIIKAGFSKGELLTLVSHMWEMVFADGRLHETEILLVERVAFLLDVSQEDVAKAMTS